MSTIYLGYARVSTEDQNLHLQMDALIPLCGDRIWTEKKSGMKAGRKHVREVIAEAKRLKETGEEITLVVYSLSRLGRRVVEVLGMVEDLRSHGIGFKSVSESIDTSTPMGRCFLTIVAAMGQVEAELVQERSKAGLKAAKARGKKLGRKAVDHTSDVEKANDLLRSGASIRSAAKSLNMSHTTLLRLINRVF